MVHEIINDIPNIEIIETTYLRNKERNDQKKKLSERDSSYFENAEKRLYTEIGLVLNLSFDDTKKYIIDKAENLDRGDI